MAASTAMGLENLQPGDCLYVDLDGTLARADTFWESVILLIAKYPLQAWRLPLWAFRGRRVVKREVANRAIPPVSTLPYQEDVLHTIRSVHERGVQVVLATAADRQIAEAVSQHLGVFDGVLASEGQENLKGNNKLRSIFEHSAGHPWGYIGNDRADWPILDAASVRLIAANSPRQVDAMRRRYRSVPILGRPASVLRACLELIRPQQWVKNVLVLVPLILAHRVSEPGPLLHALLAMVAFSFCASAVYVVNDLFDIQADRKHPRKRNRPLASGRVSVPLALVLATVLVVVSVGLSLAFLPLGFTLVLVLYLVMSQAYSLFIKRVAILDVIVLAGLYAIRLQGGAEATQVPISGWLLAFALFFFLSLAFVKRYAELQVIRSMGENAASRRDYSLMDGEILRIMGATSGYISILVLALYTTSEVVTALYPRADMLWLLGPVLLYWVSRVWLLAHRGQLADDPIVFAVRDRVSYFLGALAAAVGAMAAVP